MVAQTTAKTAVDRVMPAAYAAAGLSLVAALIHLWVAPEHFVHWWGYGSFFLVAAFAQGLASALVLRYPESKPVLLAGITGNLLIVVLYVISSTWGMPFGASWVPFDPTVAHLEDTELLGMTATAAEVGIIIAMAALLDGATRRFAINALLLAGVALWALRITGLIP
ncbi:MAG TPA: hypothetical protein VKA73_02645 [Rubrobacter sp.]|nr:hypothetical protein [Rubrobacter sp.]